MSTTTAKPTTKTKDTPVWKGYVDLPTKMAQRLETYRADRRAMLDRAAASAADLTAVYWKERLQKLRDDAAADLDKLAGQETSSRAVIEALLQPSAAAPSDSTNALLAESAWQKAKAVLDNLKGDPHKIGREAVKLARGAASDGDTAMVAALQRNLPLYLRASVYPNTPQEEHELAAFVEQTAADLANVASPDDADARLAFAKGAKRVQVAVQQVLRDLDEEGNETVVPGFAAGEVLTVPAMTPGTVTGGTITTLAR